MLALTLNQSRLQGLRPDRLFHAPCASLTRGLESLAACEGSNRPRGRYATGISIVGDGGSLDEIV